MGFYFDNLRAYHLELEAEQGVQARLRSLDGFDLGGVGGVCAVCKGIAIGVWGYSAI